MTWTLGVASSLLAYHTVSSGHFCLSQCAGITVYWNNFSFFFLLNKDATSLTRLREH